MSFFQLVQNRIYNKRYFFKFFLDKFIKKMLYQFLRKRTFLKGENIPPESNIDIKCQKGHETSKI